MFIGMSLNLEVVDFDGLQWVSGFEPENLRVEIEFSFQCAFDVFGTPEAMLFAFEGNVSH
jgi:hypothetical protein